MRNYKRRAVNVFDNVRHCERFTAARNADQNLRTDTV